MWGSCLRGSWPAWNIFRAQPPRNAPTTTTKIIVTKVGLSIITLSPSPAPDQFRRSTPKTLTTRRVKVPPDRGGSRRPLLRCGRREAGYIDRIREEEGQGTKSHTRGWQSMRNAAYYRDQAERARRLADGVPGQSDVRKSLRYIAQNYDEVAEDIEQGVIEVRHPELTPQI
jgi:hypothetical protein